MLIMKIHKQKCEECDKLIEGISEKEVSAWMKQHKHYAHKRKLIETN